MSKKTTNKKLSLQTSKTVKANSKKKTSTRTSSKGNGTWESLTQNHFLQVPKVAFQLCRFQDRKGTVWNDFQVRHLVLLLSLQARKYKGKEVRAYWEEISRDLGVSKATVRKWAYELEDMKLLKINRYGRHDGKARPNPGKRNDRNGFDLQPFVNALANAEKIRVERNRNKKSPVKE